MKTFLEWLKNFVIKKKTDLFIKLYDKDQQDTAMV